jgi:apolipoprotein N-acyltransferase
MTSITSRRLEDPKALSKVRWALLLAGTLAAFFSNGNAGTWLGALLAPVLLLGFVMTTGVWTGLAALLVVWTAAGYAMFRGAIPMSDAEYAVFALLSGFLSALPFLLHRVAAPKLGALSGSLVFPSVSTGLGYVLSVGSPFGTWGHEGYMLTALAPLAQIASVVGIWGITFIVGWAASAAVALGYARNRRTLKAAAVVAVVLAGAVGLGAWRLQLPVDELPKVRVAALSNPAGMSDRFFEGCGARDDYPCRTAKAQARWEHYFAASIDAARAGAKVVVWPEAAAQYDEHDEAAFIDRASDFARAHGVHLVVGAARVAKDQGAPMQNKAFAFSPEGGLALTYHKSIPVPGEPIAPGDGRIRTLDTDYGRLGVMICFDADFPALSRQAAARGVDILAVPANDWRAITPLHGEMVRMRAIENGFSVVRAASNGLSLLIDPVGRVLAGVNSFDTPGAIAMADVPARQVKTLYGDVDDQFGGLAVLAALGLVLAAAWQTWRARSRRTAPVPTTDRVQS